MLLDMITANAEEVENLAQMQQAAFWWNGDVQPDDSALRALLAAAQSSLDAAAPWSHDQVLFRVLSGQLAQVAEPPLVRQHLNIHRAYDLADRLQ